MFRKKPVTTKMLNPLQNTNTLNKLQKRTKNRKYYKKNLYKYCFDYQPDVYCTCYTFIDISPPVQLYSCIVVWKLTLYDKAKL